MRSRRRARCWPAGICACASCHWRAERPCRRPRNFDGSAKRRESAIFAMRPSPIRSFRRPSRSSGARSRKCGAAAPRWSRKARAGDDRRTRIGTRMSDKGMFGNLGNLMKQAQAMQERLAKVQAEVATKTVQASAGGGMVTVVATGALEIVSVKIDPEVLKASDGEMLQDLVVAAVNEALRKAREMFFFQAEDGIRDKLVTGVQTCALPI